MRLIQIPIKNYDALIHDIIKNTTILLSIEVLQTMAMGESLFDPMFLNIVLFTILGNLIFYLIVDMYLLGSGPVLSGQSDIN